MQAVHGFYMIRLVRVGKVSYTANVSTTGSTMHINLTVPEAWMAAAASENCKTPAAQAWCAAPRGGVMMRVRTPPSLGNMKATVGGKTWTSMADRETLSFSLQDLSRVPRASWQNIVIFF